ncbi:MAG TPA: DUF4136 domain-containing protein [Cyclobacteriaceae bacterium]|nr:DUF4136 domain-containing protein [Cyclobacteriaceae bacterium]
MINRLSICLAVAGMLLLGSCAVTDIGEDVDFSQYKTFGWGKAEVSVSSPAYKSGLISSKIRKGVKAEFERHGLMYDKKDPDLLVSYETFTKEKEQMSAGGYGAYPYMMPGMYRGFYPYMWGYPYMPYGGGYPGRMFYYTEGTLIIDITDAKTKEHIWRGLVKGNVSDVKALQKSIAKGVKAIMKKYPGAVDPSRETIEVPPKKRVS